MFGVGVPEALILLVLYLAVPVVIGYWVIRLAVRHGVQDARRRHDAERNRPESTRLDL